MPPPPGVWGVPPWTGRNLAARDEQLAEISAALAKRGMAPLCGLGGAGKTMLALEYAHRNASAYDIVYMIAGDSTWSLLSGFSALAMELRVPDQELVLDEATSSQTSGGSKTSSRQPRVVTAVKNRLGRRGRWLLIFDGVLNAQLLDHYLPSVAQGGHVLMTSTNPIWRGLATVTVRGLSRAESVGFLLRRTGEIDAEAADALAEKLGDLPLALAQAGAYIEETGRPLAEYVNLFRQRPAALLERPQSFPVTVATAWESALAEVFQNSTAADLLSLLSALPIEEVPRKLLASMYDPLVLDDAIAVLRVHSLVEVRPTGLFVHRLVKVIVHHQLRPEDQRRWKVAADRILRTTGLRPSSVDPADSTEPDRK
ncbi:Putative ATP/GTP-binding protein [Chondromyces apiculatus DSM 436]|uniref:Putative ATP/GTP-binding protein n=1 Tax=Chondromyces apiculatus DSM 436 TaxID=1192034 RepID=A0A017T3Q0_9BACT|nr:Putative ATP/GTP-binding protein [Chondromyces apiculatus DSM 436]